MNLTHKKGLWLFGTMRRALIALTLVAVIPMLLIQAWIYYGWFQDRAADQRQSSLVLARAVASSFEAYINDVHRQEIALGDALSSFSRSTDEANDLLERSANEYSAILSFDWADARGEIIASSIPSSIGRSIADQEYFASILNGKRWVVSNLLEGDDHQIVIVAERMRDKEGRLTGLLEASILPENIGALSIPISQPEGAMITIFDRHGALAYHWPRTVNPSVNWLKVDPLLEDALSGKQMIGQVVSPFDGRDRVAVRVPIHGIGWVAGSSEAEEQMMAPLWKSFYLETGMLLLVVTLSFAVALLIARTIIQALERLRFHVQVVGEGRLDHRAEAGGFTEFDELAVSFNRMAAQLQERRRAEERANHELAQANHELEAFAYSVSHDLRGPLRSIDGFSQALLEDYHQKIDDEGKDWLRRVRAASQRMGQLIDDLLKLSRITRADMNRRTVDLSGLARSIAEDLQRDEPGRTVEFLIQDGIEVEGDEHLLRIAMENLLGNAWKFTRKVSRARIEFGGSRENGGRRCFVRDNGAGFDMAYADKLFGPFQRLHSVADFPGTGIGLATVQRVVHRHGGKVWAEAEPGKGAAFYFTL